MFRSGNRNSFSRAPPIVSRRSYVAVSPELTSDPNTSDDWGNPLLSKEQRRESTSEPKRRPSSISLALGLPSAAGRAARRKGGCPSFLILFLCLVTPLAIVFAAGAYTSRTNRIRPLEALEWRKSQPCGICASSPDSCELYGEENLQVARSYQGTGRRLRRLLRKAASGAQIKTAVIGGSVSEGVGCPENQRWHEQVANWFNTTFPGSPPVQHVVGAVPGRGSEYFLACHGEHIDQDVDLVLIELGINDWDRADRYFHTMEALVRAILSYPNRPAVMFAESFTIFLPQLSTGTDMHVGIANYYDIPTISLRNWLLPHLLDYPELKETYFFGDRDGSGQHNDYLHISPLTHTALADQLKAVLDQQNCLVKNGLGQKRSTAKHPWPEQVEEPQNAIPRLRVTDHWSDDLVIPPPKSACLSLDSPHPESQLTPLPTSNGWFQWEDGNAWRNVKTYLRAEHPGNRVDFEVDLIMGSWTLYYLRSPKKNLGNLWCWSDDDRAGGRLVEGYWTRQMDIGEVLPMQDGLSRGKHTIHCEVLESTLDPEGGHNFLIIALMSA